MNQFVRASLLALPLFAAALSPSCAKSKRQPTVVEAKPKKQDPGPAQPKGGDQQPQGGDGDQGASLPGSNQTGEPTTDSGQQTNTNTPDPSLGTAGNGNTNYNTGNGNTNYNTGNGNTNYNTGNGNSNYNAGNGATTPTDAEVSLHIRRLNDWDNVGDRLPQGSGLTISDQAN